MEKKNNDRLKIENEREGNIFSSWKYFDHYAFLLGIVIMAVALDL